MANDQPEIPVEAGSSEIVVATAEQPVPAPKSKPRRSLTGPAPTRTLRARPSLPGPAEANGSTNAPLTPSANGKKRAAAADQAIDSSTANGVSRDGPGDGGVEERRMQLVDRLETELREVVDSHDTAVREKFHLERFTTILEGWDPASAKKDNSPVYTDWQRTNHNLLNLVPAEAGPSQVGGPSRRSRSSLPARQTRRAAQEQSERIAGLHQSPAKHTAHEAVTEDDTTLKSAGKGKGKADDSPDAGGSPGSIKGKGRARRGEESAVNAAAGATQRGKFRRQTVSGVDTDDAGFEAESAAADSKKRRSRPSLPNLPAKRSKLRYSIGGDDRGSATPSQAEGTPGADTMGDAQDPTPDQLPTPAELPSLAHIPFPPPPPRRPHRFVDRPMWYTEPSQRPVPLEERKFQGSIEAYLASYIHLEDTGPSPDIKALEIRAAREAYFRNRVNWLMSQGRLQRLLEEDPADAALGLSAGASKSKSSGVAAAAAPGRKQDFQDALMSHMVQVRNAMLAEAKAKPVYCRRIAKMITAYWEAIEGREEREAAAQEREMRRKAKEIVKALRKRWGLAVKIVRAKLAEVQKAEQDRRGKEHLQSMLQRSTGLLEAHREEFMADDEDDEDGMEDLEDGTDEEEPDEESDDETQGDEEEEMVHEDAELDQGQDDVEADSGGEGEAEEGDEDSQADDDQTYEEGEGEEGEDEGEEGDDEGRNGLLALLDEDEPQQDGAIRSPSPSAPDDISKPPAAAEAQIDTNGEAASLHQSSAASPRNPLTTESADVVRQTPERFESPDPLLLDSAPRTPEDNSAVPPPDRDDDSQAENAHLSPDPETSTQPNGAQSRRTRRPRKSVSVSSSMGEDPDANDDEFVSDSDDRSEQDLELDVEMEEGEAEGGASGEDGADSEDEGLLADAEMPIEELMKRYGYSMPGEATSPKGEPMDVDSGGAPADSSAANGNAVTSGHDQSLLDENLKETSPALIVEGKRQRRARRVWTPENNPPPIKKPKIEEIEEDEEVEMTPSEETDDYDEGEDAAEDDQGGEVKAILGEGDDAAGDDQKDEGPKIRVPFLLRGTLRPYQHAGLEWLASLYANNMNGILADEMGLGKTIQTISLLAHLACDRHVWGQHLIIVPTSVILNWEMEFKKFFPGMKVLTYYGNQKERKEKRVGWLTENAWQVCITSYQIVLADQHIFRRKNWVYMILDEAHNIKNFRSQRWQTLLGFKAQRRLLLTGTPLQNNLMELWSLLYFLMPHGVAEEATAVVGFANHKEFMEWFSNPMDKAIETGDALDEDTLETVAKLHTLLRPFILRRLKSEVETQLPGKFEHVVYCRLSKRQRFLYDEFMSRASTQEALTSGGYLGVVNTLMQLRKVCNHPDLFEVRPVRTSFAMERSVLADFEPSDLLVRRRLLAAQDTLTEHELFRISAREDMDGWTATSVRRLDGSDRLPHAIEEKKVGKQPPPPKPDARTVEGWLKYSAHRQHEMDVARWRNIRDHNRRRCGLRPVYGRSLLATLSDLPNRFLPLDSTGRQKRDLVFDMTPPAAALVRSLPQRARLVQPLVDMFAVVPPTAVARDMPQQALPLVPHHPQLADPEFDSLHRAAVKLQIAFPDASLLQYDCGKLQKLYEMLRQLKSEGHRVLIFTQMTRVLDILEIFLSYNGHRYLRLDGSTKIEDRQAITERFNSDPRIFCFIASSRSGGVGINLTGADTVFFYDSDWNPSMDRQCMDRAHRIGQTREVHIYRFVSSHTVEENMLKKANQKRLLDRVVIQEGDFTTEFFGKMDWRDMLDQPKLTDATQPDDSNPAISAEEERDGVEDVELEPEPEAEDVVQSGGQRAPRERELASVFAQVEDEEDVAAARMAQGEGELDFAEFAEAQASKKAAAAAAGGAPGHVRFESAGAEGSATPVPAAEVEAGDEAHMEGGEDDDEPGAVDEYMLRWVEENWDYFVSYR